MSHELKVGVIFLFCKKLQTKGGKDFSYFNKFQSQIYLFNVLHYLKRTVYEETLRIKMFLVKDQVNFRLFSVDELSITDCCNILINLKIKLILLEDIL